MDSLFSRLTECADRPPSYSRLATNQGVNRLATPGQMEQSLMTYAINSLAVTFSVGVSPFQIISCQRMRIGLGIMVLLTWAIGLGAAYSAEIRLIDFEQNRLEVNGKPVDRCIKEDSTRDGTRCGATARERVADELCRNRGHIGAVNGTVSYQGGIPRSVSMFDSSERRFVAGTGYETISAVLCTTADPLVRLSSPANNAAILLDKTITPELNLTWTVQNALAIDSIVGCLQRQRQFNNNSITCAGTTWSDNGRSRRRSISNEDLRAYAGQTVYWSVRTCARSPNGNLSAGGQRVFCSNWALRQALNIAAAMPQPKPLTGKKPIPGKTGKP